MYPTIVVALIDTKRSMTDNYQLDVISTSSVPRIAHVATSENDQLSNELASEDRPRTARSVRQVEVE